MAEENLAPAQSFFFPNIHPGQSEVDHQIDDTKRNTTDFTSFYLIHNESDYKCMHTDTRRKANNEGLPRMLPTKVSRQTSLIIQELQPLAASP